MRVHPSNFRTVGFTEETPLPELVALGRSHGVAVIDDLGSGVPARCTHELGDLLRDEPAVRDSIEAGADVVCFSTDKLLGGPQGGIVAGRPEAIERMRSHPLARALRIDKLSLAALEATLRLHRDPERAIRDVPVLQMLATSHDELATRAERLRAEIAAAAPAGAAVRVVSAAARAGGGSLPLLELKGPAVSITSSVHGPAELHARLRRSDPPVVARVRDDALLLDPRTLAEVEVEFVVRAVLGALDA
jgi:L-seryl-tRNA(Ser) seleniumtransferase